MKLTPVIAFLLIGFSATVGQILVLRELLTAFSGSELAVALVLSAWLFWTALGALLGGKISQYGFAGHNLMSIGHDEALRNKSKPLELSSSSIMFLL